jgi:branched-chain amino acid transport system permease protein
VLRDLTLYLWGPEDLLGPKAPGLKGAVEIFGRRVPTYDLFLIVVGPLVLAGLWLLLTRTRFGTLIRAATQDREMVASLGVDQSKLFTAVFALGAGLAGLGGALALPREPANLNLDISTIGDAFVVVVVGGMGSIPGAYVAALIIALIKALCVFIGQTSIFGIAVNFSKFTLVAEFVVMALVLIWRPWGLFGRQEGVARTIGSPEPPIPEASPQLVRALILGTLALALVPLLGRWFPYLPVIGIEMLIAVLFAASLHFIMGPGGLHSFGHAAYFGLGAYGAGLLLKRLGWPMELAILAAPFIAMAGAALFGWFAVRLSGVYLAMLTLAFAQIIWSIAFQWDDLTGGSNGIVGVWPSAWAASKPIYYLVTLAITVVFLWLLRRIVLSPFGLALRGARDHELRAEAIGIDVARIRLIAFVIAGGICGVAGALFAFSKGSISHETIGVGRSIDGLVMVLLGGMQSLFGPIFGAAVFVWLQDTIARLTDYWRATLGLIMLLIVLLLPSGLAGLKRVFIKEARP